VNKLQLHKDQINFTLNLGYLISFLGCQRWTVTYAGYSPSTLTNALSSLSLPLFAVVPRRAAGC